MKLPRWNISTIRSAVGIIAAGIFIISLIAGWYAVSKPYRLEEEFQAVFLNNGQVYFGRASKNNLWQMELTDVYYLQLADPIQGENAKLDPSGNLSLVKLGDELHSPKDRMIIPREQILFIEDLKDSSKVVQAIRAYRGNGK